MSTAYSEWLTNGIKTKIIDKIYTYDIDIQSVITNDYHLYLNGSGFSLWSDHDQNIIDFITETDILSKETITSTLVLAGTYENQNYDAHVINGNIVPTSLTIFKTNTTYTDSDNIKNLIINDYKLHFKWYNPIISGEQLSVFIDETDILNNNFSSFNINDTQIISGEELPASLTKYLILKDYKVDKEHDYPYFIVPTSADITIYQNKDLKFNKYIPYNYNYLYDKKTYKYIPSGESELQLVTTILSTVIKHSDSGEETTGYIECLPNNTSLEDYNNNLNNTYYSIISSLNDEYTGLSISGRAYYGSDLSGNYTDTQIKNRMNELLKLILIDIPTQYNDAKLKLISSEITLSGIQEYETISGFNVYFNATEILSYAPTGIVTTSADFEYISGGEPSSTADCTGYIPLTEKDTDYIITNNGIKLNLIWPIVEYTENIISSQYTYQSITYIEPIFNTYNSTNYNLVSTDVDEWFNYYAKEYHDNAVNIILTGLVNNSNLPAHKLMNTFNDISGKVNSAASSSDRTSGYIYNLSSIYTRNSSFVNCTNFLVGDEINYKDGLVILNYLCEANNYSMTYNYTNPGVRYVSSNNYGLPYRMTRNSDNLKTEIINFVKDLDRNYIYNSVGFVKSIPKR